MTTLVVFRVDPKLKNRASKKAAEEGTNLSAVLKMATQAFVDGEFEVGLKCNQRTQKNLSRILHDIKRGKNLSPSFRDVKSMIKSLKE